MTAGWIVRALIVSVCISIAALCVERLLARTNRSTARNQRWVWVAAMLASIAVPLASLWGKWAPPILSTILGPGREVRLVAEVVQGGGIAMRSAPGIEDFGVALLGAWFRYVQAPVLRDYALSVQAIVWASLTLSMLGIALFVAIHLWIRRRRMDWASSVVEGVDVRVAASVGPAVIGFRNPEIVIPVWVLGAPQETQQAIIRHECSHIVAGDSRTLVLCSLLLAAMPWNVVLWWQYRRLRAAIETDCDARVLAGGIDVRQYGAMLLNVATRSIPVPLLSPAFCANPSLIERRIRAMTKRSFRFVHVQFAALACLALVTLGMSVELSAPKAPQIRYIISAIDLPIFFHGSLHIASKHEAAQEKSWFGANGWSQRSNMDGATEHDAAYLPNRDHQPIRLVASGAIRLAISSGTRRAPVEIATVSVGTSPTAR